LYPIRKKTLRLSIRRPCGLVEPAWVFLFLLFVLLPAASNSKEYPAKDYPEELAEKAVSMGLHEKREWQVLLHYKPTLSGNMESLVDDPAFFVSKTGKYDPASELAETVKAFFASLPEGDGHAQCRFIGRFDWLKKELSMDERLLPPRECKGFREFHESLNPKSAVLIFPVSHMNSPASMFGHTLLRIDSDRESKLFSWAVNYSAKTGETNGIFFAVKGIFGYYEGFYGVLPYYEKIKEYSNLENRDIWEYRLEFTPEEVERMLLHLWELKDVYTYYYFFDENCSYNLLLVLEAARPGIDLFKGLPPWVIPMDTIKSVRNAGVSSRGAEYRPSRAAKIKHLEGLVQGPLKNAAIKIASGAEVNQALNKDPWPIEQRAASLELATEYIQYRYAKKAITKEEYTRLFLKVLGERSALGQVALTEPKTPVEPEGGHGPARLSLAVGAKSGDAFLSVALRPANHSLTDPDAGYLPGAAITFMEAEARYYLDQRKLALHEFTFVGIDSVSPRDEFFKPISWTVKAVVEREETGKREHRTVLKTTGGPGLSYAFSGNGLAYGFIEPAVKIGSGLDDGYSLGIGSRLGLLKPLTHSWKAQLEFMAASFGPGDSHTVISAALNQTFSLNMDNAIKLNFRREKFDGFYSTEAVLGWNTYF